MITRDEIRELANFHSPETCALTPCCSALRRAFIFPGSVTGPVDFRLLARLAATIASVGCFRIRLTAPSPFQSTRPEDTELPGATPAQRQGPHEPVRPINR